MPPRERRRPAGYSFSISTAVGLKKYLILGGITGYSCLNAAEMAARPGNYINCLAML
jgi:hypothetical protein